MTSLREIQLRPGEEAAFAFFAAASHGMKREKSRKCVGSAIKKEELKEIAECGMRNGEGGKRAESAVISS
jgi:hypothetical protein